MEIIPKNDDAPQRLIHDAQRFIALLEPRGQFTFQTFTDRPGGTTRPVVLHGPLEEHGVTLRRLNAAGAGIFVTVNQTDLKGRKASNISRVRAFFVDLDGSPLEPVLSGPLPPHIVIETSHGKWHCYWLIDHCDMEHFGFIQKKLAQRFGGDEKVIDLPRVMRLPGFLHQKKEPFLSRIVKATEGRYPLADFLKAFNIRLPERNQSPEPTRQASRLEVRGEVGAYDGELGKHLSAIAAAEVGTRNDTLNARAFLIGRLVATGHIPKWEALRAILEAAAGIDNAKYHAERAIKDGIQAGPYRIPAPLPHFPGIEPLPPVEARAELSNATLNIINQAEDWKFLLSEIKTKTSDIRNQHGNPSKTKPPSATDPTAFTVEYSPSREAYLACQLEVRRTRKHILAQSGFADTKHAPRDMVRATPGLGKTRTTVATILESGLDLVFFYVPTTKLAEELATAYLGQVKAIKGRCPDNCTQSIACQFAGARGIPVYGTFCAMEMEGRPPIKCPDFDRCKYLAQFKPTGEKIIALSHEYLGLDFPLLRQLGTPDLHVIDESIISLVAGVMNFQPAMLPADFRDMQPGDDAQARAIERGWMLDDVKAYRAECYQQMQEETLAGARGLHPGMDAELALAKMKSATTTGAAQRWRFFSTLACQWELGKGSEAIRVGTKIVPVDGVNEQQNRVFVSFKRELAGLRESEPVLLLDADGDIDINRALVSARMQEHIVEAARNVRVIQVSTSSSKTALGLPDKVASDKLKRMSTLIRDFIPGKKVVVTYKDAKPLADFGLDDADITHFGGFLGKNEWENHDIAIVLGRNLPPCDATEDLARAIFMDSPEPLALPGRYEQAMQGYVMRDESHRGAKVQAHPDPRVNGLLDVMRGRMSAQAADRLRLVNDDKPKLVILLDATPTPLPVDALLTETGFMAMLAVGKLVSQGGGFAVIDRPVLEGLGFSRSEGENAIKSMTTKIPTLHPSILNSIYGGANLESLNLAFHEVGTKDKPMLVVTTLGPDETARRILRLNPVHEALARSSTGLIPLSPAWLNENFPELFTSKTDAARYCALVTPTGIFRVQGKRTASKFLSGERCIDPRATLEAMAEAPLAEYDGPMLAANDAEPPVAAPVHDWPPAPEPVAANDPAVCPVQKAVPV